MALARMVEVDLVLESELVSTASSLRPRIALRELAATADDDGNDCNFFGYVSSHVIDLTGDAKDDQVNGRYPY